MKPTVIFVRVCGKPEYEPGAQRWLASYRAHKPKIPHELVVINRYKDGPDNSFDDVATAQVRYDGLGWDCGAWQFAGKNIPAELLVCFNSSTFIMGDGWLERIVEAVETHGEGLYGPLASFEIIPHIRTPCMIFTPRVINRYPAEVVDRQSTYSFEVFGFTGGPENFTQFTRAGGFKTMLVTWSCVYDLPQWRTPKNIFRNGDQSDLIVWDRHAEAYSISDAAGKAVLEKLADGR